MDGLKTLAEVCELTGVTRRAIQGYEKAELVDAKSKNKYGHLLYDVAAVKRIEKIRFYQQLGFKVREIKRIIDAPSSVLKPELERKLMLLKMEVEVKEQVIVRVQKMIEELE